MPDLPGRPRKEGLDVNEETIAHMRARVAQCRRLAAGTTDRSIVDALIKMAEEGEADIKRWEAQRDGGPS